MGTSQALSTTTGTSAIPSTLVWLVPMLPFIGFLLLAFLGKSVPKKVAGPLATLLVFGSFAVSILLLMQLPEGPNRRQLGGLLPGLGAATWIEVGTFRVNWEALIDPLSLLMCLIVTGVGGLIHLYSIGYMKADRDSNRFFMYLNLFIFFMLLLVLGNNLLLMFVGWEGVGLCSYLLISFWFEDVENSKAGNKAMIVNRIGDIGFALGIMAVFHYFGSVKFYSVSGDAFLDLARMGQVNGFRPLTGDIANLIGILLFIGAMSKSAQFPLHTWLPDAMAGPTPVSALIHAATMVTAGVVMIARISPLYVHAPLAMTTIACVGIFTAFFAATIALTQQDIKKVLAYSTVSQLGYMFLGVGVGAFWVGMFHVTTHAFFKALLFLGSGSVIHAMHGEQDMRKMGGLGKKIRITYLTMCVGWLAIAGFPFLSGFFSKDEILGFAAGNKSYGMIFYAVGLFTALLTAIYMTRLMSKTFEGAPRYDEEHLGSHGHGHSEDESAEEHAHAPGVHESPMTMLFPLMVLALLSAVAGFGGHALEKFLSPSLAEFKIEHGISPTIGMVVGGAVAILGIVIARVMFAKTKPNGELWETSRKQTSPLWLIASNLWFVDRSTTAIAVTGGGIFAAVWSWIDRNIVDGVVNGVAGAAAIAGEAARRLQTGYVRSYALSMLLGVVLILFGLLWSRLVTV